MSVFVLELTLALYVIHICTAGTLLANICLYTVNIVILDLVTNIFVLKDFAFGGKHCLNIILRAVPLCQCTSLY